MAPAVTVQSDPFVEESNPLYSPSEESIHSSFPS